MTLRRDGSTGLESIDFGTFKLPIQALSLTHSHLTGATKMDATKDIYSSLHAAQDVARGACFVAWPADEPYTEPAVHIDGDGLPRGNEEVRASVHSSD